MQPQECPINVSTMLNDLDELWQLKTVAESDTHFFKVIKFEGEFQWHTHADEKILMVLEGKMAIDFRDREKVMLEKGNTFFVPGDVEHKPIADGVCGIMLIEKR